MRPTCGVHVQALRSTGNRLAGLRRRLWLACSRFVRTAQLGCFYKKKNVTRLTSLRFTGVRCVQPVSRQCAVYSCGYNTVTFMVTVAGLVWCELAIARSLDRSLDRSIARP